ncbi:MAG TPA: sigma-70 family RNA polymerase sigma factor [Candidatus Hydrogenedentes bacterium]|nr:sigma-70 family RNA polymerase sigma factor [Candidatus Hydrogenedentota bacterium]HQE84306.1 sigma-70 family RNA polymerase sigma factor [Candidatus Hydrogenedentota bacterium]HQH54201.1 sigma-70 family RNA polymerase sigma factor [Candidatus Hydrogenedentota bacterium]HQM50075.1 sigma-70 family RNA polymerase sigma factor [Candidatus Hydrogenedentota bacterium]
MAKTVDNTNRRSHEFEQLVLDHMDMLYAVALRLTRNPADAQDLTQNTVVKALRFHDKFQKGTYIKAWLLTILRNTFINDYRRKARRPVFVELSGAEPSQDIPPDPEVGYEPRERTGRELLELLDDEVKRAVETLPHDFREAVIMADLEDMSYKEIAEAMDCPLGTVMSRLYRGRKLLRESLYDYAKDLRLVDKNTPKQEA